MQRLRTDELRQRADFHMQQHLEANGAKAFLEAEGYKYTMSLYGVLYNPETMKPEYRRIEVFLSKVPTPLDVGAIKQFFTDIKPYPYYSIWIYNSELKEIGLIDSWQ